MTKPQSLPVEEARKKFADILDGTQHHNQHVEITRRGKSAGYVVPPEWYVSVTAEVEALRKKVEELSTPAMPKDARPAVAAPRKQVTQAVPEHPEPPEWLELSPEVAALSYERARKLFTDAESTPAHMGWGNAQRRALDRVPSGWRFHAGVQAGITAGVITLTDATEEN